MPLIKLPGKITCSHTTPKNRLLQLPGKRILLLRHSMNLLRHSMGCPAERRTRPGMLRNPMKSWPAGRCGGAKSMPRETRGRAWECLGDAWGTGRERRGGAGKERGCPAGRCSWVTLAPGSPAAPGQKCSVPGPIGARTAYIYFADAANPNDAVLGTNGPIFAVLAGWAARLSGARGQECSGIL